MPELAIKNHQKKNCNFFTRTSLKRSCSISVLMTNGYWVSLLAITMVLAVGTLTFQPVFADNDKLEEKIEKIQEKIEKLEEKLANASGDKAAKLQDKIDKLQEKIEKLQEKANKNSDTRISLRDLGLLQLAAHDFFNVDRCNDDISCAVDHEDGKLNLSTLFEHGYDNIIRGGEPRNRENIILFTVASEFGIKYQELIDKGQTTDKAKEKIVKMYHQQLEKTYKKTFEESFPRPSTGDATATENLAFRTIHDFLPGKININGEERETLDHDLIGQTLTKKELKQSSSPLDGTFDEEFLDIVIVIPTFPGQPPIELHINLLERDSSFAEQFSTDVTFEEFLTELEDGSYDTNDRVMNEIRNLFSKGLNF